MATVMDMTNEDTVLAMESTACEPHHAVLPEFSGVSSITSQSESAEIPEQQQLRVYLKVRPFSEEELKSNEHQGCVVLEDSETVALHAPKGSATMKSSEKGIGQQVYKFSFTQIFGPKCTQTEFFEGTISSQVHDFLQGKNALVFSYGVTNAGKTYTIQGSQKDPGILPRALDAVFKHIAGRQYEHMDLKPYLSSDVQKLDSEQVKVEKNAKAALFSLLKELVNLKLKLGSVCSHSIFTIKLIRIEGADVQGLSDLSLCDLAGSERCNKTKTFGERLKEAGNINNSLLILGKCIAALRNNQSYRVKMSYVPFRESKLTRLFQGMFCGRGKACMIVNINQCASTYDETLHVMKFSAVAKQVIPQRSIESLAPRLVGLDGKPLLKNGVIDDQALDEYLSEEELLDGDEADMSILPQEELVNLVESLRVKLLAERRKNLLQEIQIRKEMGDAMLQQIMEAEELHSRQLVDLKESYEEKMDSTFEMYKEALKDHAYQCALERLEEDYIPVDEFNEEQERELEKLVFELEQKCRCSAPQPLMQDNSMQTSPLPATESESERFKMLYKEKCAVEKLCVEKQELIVSLERRIGELNETLQEAGESYMEKLAEVQNLQNRLSNQEQKTECLQSDVVAKEEEINRLREEIATLASQSVGQSRPRCGLLVNIKESMTPSTGSLCRTIKKSVRASTLRKKPS
ncbi:Kinesin-like protein KIF20A [Anabarilius grahami]|uniref:Kinesin-like protein KIF20A n=1 Tax=Anabarilius grahami TaxID=495550 RepID=A0A3N0YRJ7_ANAGA|nr:Kinesin-like protein KIF20A [Anabarilius grahami]